MFQPSHHKFTAVRSRCSLQRTRRSCFCRVNTDIASRARWVPGAARVLFIYRLHNIGARTEPWRILAAIFLGVENSPSTKTLNFIFCQWEKKQISLIKLVKKFWKFICCPRYIVSAQTAQKTLLFYCCIFIRCLAMARLFDDVRTCLLCQCLATDAVSC
jgi:hypothetical protein